MDTETAKELVELPTSVRQEIQELASEMDKFPADVKKVVFDKKEEVLMPASPVIWQFPEKSRRRVSRSRKYKRTTQSRKRRHSRSRSRSQSRSRSRIRRYQSHRRRRSGSKSRRQSGGGWNWFAWPKVLTKWSPFAPSPPTAPDNVVIERKSIINRVLDSNVFVKMVQTFIPGEMTHDNLSKLKEEVRIRIERAPSGLKSGSGFVSAFMTLFSARMTYKLYQSSVYLLVVLALGQMLTTLGNFLTNANRAVKAAQHVQNVKDLAQQESDVRNHLRTILHKGDEATTAIPVKIDGKKYDLSMALDSWDEKIADLTPPLRESLQASSSL